MNSKNVEAANKATKAATFSEKRPYFILRLLLLSPLPCPDYSLVVLAASEAITNSIHIWSGLNLNIYLEL